jgi:cell division protein YceG involved in septum cleavage
VAEGVRAEEGIEFLVEKGSNTDAIAAKLKAQGFIKTTPFTSSCPR